MAYNWNSEIVKEYAINAGANVIGIAAAKDFGFAPNGFKPKDGCRTASPLLFWALPFHLKSLTIQPIIPQAAMKCLTI